MFNILPTNNNPPTTDLTTSNPSSPNIPSELFWYIFDFCDIKSKQNLTLVSHKFRKLVIKNNEIVKKNQFKSIDEKITKLASNPSDENVYFNYIIYILETQGFEKARELIQKITDQKQKLNVLQQIVFPGHTLNFLDAVSV